MKGVNKKGHELVECECATPLQSRTRSETISEGNEGEPKRTLCHSSSRPESSWCQKKDAAASTSGSEIQRTLGLFDSFTLYGVGIDHGGPDIRVSEQFLNRADIIIGLQEMGGKAVAEGMG